VLEWEGYGVKFKLAEQLAVDPTFVSPSSPQVMADQVEVLPEGEEKLGADGLSAEMQSELLGRVMDARPGKKKD
jgi:hypothetical protein